MTRQTVDVDKPWHRSIPFAQGVTVRGNMLFTAGITARDPEGNLLGTGDIRRQMEVCFENLGDVLKAAGASFEDIVKIVMYTTDIDAFNEHAEVWRQYFVARPASTLVEVSRLAVPEMSVEIEAVVHLGD